MKEYYVVKPKNLDLENRIKQTPPHFKFSIDFAYLVISEIIQANAYDQYDNNKFIPRSSLVLERYNYLYKKHMRYLGDNIEGLGNVIWRENYTKGKSYGYKLAPQYACENLEVYVIKNFILLGNINDNDCSKITSSVKKNYKFLIKYFDSKRLTVMIDHAMLFNESLYNDNKNYQKYLYNISKILNIQNGKFFLSHKPETDGRLHSNITTFPKLLRKFLRYDGKILAEVDISASVPTFLIFLIKNLTTPNQHIDKIINNYKSYYTQYILVKNSVSLDIKEIKLFLELVQNGTLYEYFVEGFNTVHLFNTKLKPDQYFQKEVFKTFNRPFDGDMDDLIKIAKTNILAMLNSDPIQYVNEKAVFQNCFPTIHNFILKFKTKDHKFFSHMMLQIESHFMLNVIARPLNKKYWKTIPILTLHDCIITTEDNLDFVKAFMENTFLKELGFAPMLKTKIYK